MLEFQCTFIVQIFFVEKDGNRNAICFGSNEEPVNETGGSSGHYHTYNQISHVNICSDYLRLFGEIDSLSDDVILSFEEGIYNACFAVIFKLKFYSIANSKRIGGNNSFQSECSFYLTIQNRSVIGTNHI